MGGLVLLLILGVWFFIANKFSAFMSKKMNVGELKNVVHVLLALLIFVAPMADEIIARIQFRALCETETQLKYDKNELTNKEVYSDTLEAEKIENLAIPVFSQMQTYTESNSHVLVLHYKVLNADGGWLSRSIGFNSVNQPYTFDGSCGPKGENVQQLLKKLNVKVINDPS